MALLPKPDKNMKKAVINQQSSSIVLNILPRKFNKHSNQTITKVRYTNRGPYDDSQEKALVSICNFFDIPDTIIDSVINHPKIYTGIQMRMIAYMIDNHSNRQKILKDKQDFERVFFKDYTDSAVSPNNIAVRILSPQYVEDYTWKLL